MAYSHRAVGIKWLFFRYAVSNFFFFFFQKPIDKSIRLCYNIDTVKKGGQHNEGYLKNKRYDRIRSGRKGF